MTMRGRAGGIRRVFAGLAVSVCLLAAGDGAKAGGQTGGVEVDRTGPGHMKPLFPTPGDPLPNRDVIRRIESRAVYNLPKGLAGLAKEDPKLSHLCLRGAFLQHQDGYFWARAPERVYGVAFSGGANLIDLQSRHKSGKVYFFENQGTSKCMVFVGDQAKLMPNYIGP
jgi:hypothetical protein